VLQNDDRVTFLATQEKAHEFFQRINMPVRPVRNALIVGGGAIAYYLSQELLENHVRVRIVERDPARCNVLAESLPEAQILNEDGSNRDFLLSEGLESTEAFVALTNIDEENVLLTLFAKKHSKGKLVTKINRLEFDDILAGLDLGSIVYPKYMTCDYIVQYVRALQNEAGNNIKTLYRILDDRVEALEFTVHEESRATGVPLSQLHLKKNLLLCCITRGDHILIPRGAVDVPSQTPHCLGSVFVIALPAEAADLVQRFHVSPKPQCHRAVDDLRVRIVLFRVRRNFLITEGDLDIPYLRRVQRKRRRHTAADIPAERRHLVAVHFIGNDDHRAVAPVPVNVRRKGLMRHQVAVVALPVCVCPVRRAVSLRTGQHP